MLPALKGKARAAAPLRSGQGGARGCLETVRVRTLCCLLPGRILWVSTKVSASGAPGVPALRPCLRPRLAGVTARSGSSSASEDPSRCAVGGEGGGRHRTELVAWAQRMRSPFELRKVNGP